MNEVNRIHVDKRIIDYIIRDSWLNSYNKDKSMILELTKLAYRLPPLCLAGEDDTTIYTNWWEFDLSIIDYYLGGW